jgi:hypothetical protein
MILEKNRVHKLGYRFLFDFDFIFFTVSDSILVNFVNNILIKIF